MDNITSSEVKILKNKFQSVLDDNSDNNVRKKKMRNVAIANILKLNSITVPDKPLDESCQKEHLKLMTPDDFINKPAKVVQDAAESNTDMEIKNESGASNIENNDTNFNIDLPTRDELQQSINKVEKWLLSENINQDFNNINDKPRILAGSLSPVTVVRKEPKIDRSTPSPSVSTVKKFVPKNQQLYKKYLENSKAKKEREEDIWARAERLMKEKEERMKSKTAEDVNSDK